MINIRKCLPNDELFILSTRIDEFIGDKDFYEIPNDVLLKAKKEIEESIKARFDNCKMIINDQETIGSFATYEYEDGIILDSLSIRDEFDTKELKAFVIKYVVSSNYGIIYTYVYKNNNSDLEVFKSLGFEIIGEENSKYKLKLNNY